MKIIFALAFINIAINASTDTELWLHFKNNHHKTYKTLQDEKLHFEVFKNNLIAIEEHNERFNKGEESYFMAINKFSDLTDEEFQDRYLSSMPYEENNSNEISWISPSKDVPNSIDWRDKGAVLSVKDQNDCGSCWAFSAIGALEGQNAIKHNIKEDLSVQELIDCSGKYGNIGCWGGWMDYAYAYIKDHGIASEENYPYKANNLQCNRSNTTRSNIKETAYKDLPNNDEIALKEAIATIGPISVAINATLIRHYGGGIFDNSGCSKGLSHGVLAVGYGTENNADYYIVKNSWGKTWGDHGYIRMARNKDNQCGIASKPSYPIIA